VDADESILAVLGAADEPLHWTMIQDRALKDGSLDPFVTPDVRGEVLSALRALVERGAIERVGKGTYRLAASQRR
jgi:hypothetical protein